MTKTKINLYKVGGCVRDSFLGLDSKDVDYAVEAPSFSAMHDWVSAQGKIFLSSPKYFTVRATFKGKPVDFVLCRKDGTYSDGRRPDSVEMGDIYDDLARRDFTMNAIAVAEKDGEVIDPYNGVQDIVDRTIRCVGDPYDRFSEDSLRLIRAVRFAITKNFKLTSAIKTILNDKEMIFKLNSVSFERIREEFHKCFVYDTLTTLSYLQEYPLLKSHVFSRTPLRLDVTLKKI